MSINDHTKILVNQLLLAFLVFAFSQGLVAAVAALADEGYFNASSWVRWDSGHYLHIAGKGYEFFPCAGKFGYPDTATEHCGNTGWFPGYPLLVGALGRLFGDTT